MLAPPEIASQLVGILRKAFWATVHDPEYIAEGKKLGFIDDGPLPGEKVQKMIKQILDIPNESKTWLRKLLELG
jgi:hypothetical protein